MTVQEPGAEIAGYRIESLIGRGGMAVVYRAEDMRLGRMVALKLLTPQLADNEQFRQRFVRESRLAASLDHPNIVPIYEAGEADGQLFIAMRYVLGSDLKGLLADEGGQLAADRTLWLFGQIGDALDSAHRAGLVHRDVKPGNILVTAGPEHSRPGHGDHVYLTDFGLTKRTAELTGGLTGTGHFLGTVDYVSPEQIQGRPVGAGTDIYALGCVLYECLTGQLPFRRDDDAALLWAHLVEAPPPVTAIRPDVPEDVNAVVARAMAKDPADRYESCRELLREFELALDLPAPVSWPRARQTRDSTAAARRAEDASETSRTDFGTVTGDVVGAGHHPSFPPGSLGRFPDDGPYETAPPADHERDREEHSENDQYDDGYSGWDEDESAAHQDEPPTYREEPVAPPAPRRRRRILALVAAVVVVLLAVAAVLLRSALFGEDYRTYANGATVVPFQLEHPADWKPVVGLASDVVLAPDPSAADQLFFQGGTPEAWASATDALGSGDDVWLYVLTSSTTFDPSQPEAFRQSIAQLLPDTTRFEPVNREVPVAGAAATEMEAVTFDPENQPRLRVLVDVVQPPGAGGAVLLAFFAPPDTFEDRRATFERIRNSLEITR